MIETNASRFSTEYGQSPRASSQRSVMPMSTTSSPDVKPEPEPLLSLLTSTHPLISSAINGSMSAYTSSKSYSPRFKSGAEFLERNIAPVANKVGTVGRKTGVESGLRWALERRGSASADSSRAKRRKVGGENNQSSDSVDVNVDVQKRQEGHASLHRARSSSDISCSESLPPYDDLRSPSYDEVSATAIPSSSKGRARSTTWQSRLMISTSGLGVAMSEESLRSLQYCLTWLRWANERLGKAILALKHTLKEWEDVKLREDQDNPDSALSRRIDAVKEDVLATLKRVVGIVSKYAGGALPENARNLVRRHLTSLPRRFQIASSAKLTPADSSVQAFDATIAGANRALVLAQEGLDIMAQVTCVVNDTLVSAEHWCDRLGKKRPDYRTRTDTPKQQQEPQSESVASDIKEPVVSSEPRNADTKELIVSLGRDTQMSGTEKA